MVRLGVAARLLLLVSLSKLSWRQHSNVLRGAQNGFYRVMHGQCLGQYIVAICAQGVVVGRRLSRPLLGVCAQHKSEVQCFCTELRFIPINQPQRHKFTMFACYICDTTTLYTSDMASTAAAASATDADVEADTAVTAVVVVGSGAGGNAGAVSDGGGDGKEEKQSSGGYRLGPDGTPASNEAYTTQQYWEARYDRYTNKLGAPAKDKDKAGKSECSNTFSLCHQ